jgi:hypothetical protein
MQNLSFSIESEMGQRLNECCFHCLWHCYSYNNELVRFNEVIPRVPFQLHVKTICGDVIIKRVSKYVESKVAEDSSKMIYECYFLALLLAMSLLLMDYLIICY